jgi:hypothetical protein
MSEIVFFQALTLVCGTIASLEVERISEANRFMAKLLAERAEAANTASRPERVITPH